LCDAISRNVDGVLGNSESLIEESFENALLEAPSFTKPQNFKEIFPPSEFLKGNHSKIRSLKFALSKVKTKYFRPEQYKRAKSLFEKQ
jgi:tRNA (guanine37-N1)-methyltransferase